MLQLKIPSAIRVKYPGLFGFERGMGAHHYALMTAMRHYESVGDDASLGLVLVALVRGRKPWLMDLRYKYFKLARLERFSEVLLVMYRWVMRNLSMPLDNVRLLLKKLEHHLPHRSKRVVVTGYLYRALEGAGRVADAYDTAQLLGRHDLMGFMRKKQMDQSIGRGAPDMYRPIDPAAWGRTARGGRSLLTDAEVRVLSERDDSASKGRHRTRFITSDIAMDGCGTKTISIAIHTILGSPPSSRISSAEAMLGHRPDLSFCPPSYHRRLRH